MAPLCPMIFDIHCWNGTNWNEMEQAPPITCLRPVIGWRSAAGFAPRVLAAVASTNKYGCSNVLILFSRHFRIWLQLLLRATVVRAVFRSTLLRLLPGLQLVSWVSVAYVVVGVVVRAVLVCIVYAYKFISYLNCRQMLSVAVAFMAQQIYHGRSAVSPSYVLLLDLYNCCV